MERAVPSFGARMNTSPLSSAFAAVRFCSARVLATAKSQFVVICPMILACSSRVSSALPCRATASLEFLITKVPSATFGCSTDHAPEKNTNALLSEAAPAYRYNGRPLPEPALSTRNCPWAFPTLKLLNVAKKSTASVLVIRRSYAMTLTPAAFAFSAAAAAAFPSCGQMISTLMPLAINASTFAASLAESPWLNRISASYPAAFRASLNRVSSCTQRGSSLVGSTIPTAN